MTTDARRARRMDEASHHALAAGLELYRRLAWPLVRAPFAGHGGSWGRNWKIFGRPILQRHRGSRIALGDGERGPVCNPVSAKPFCLQVVASDPRVP